ncbi:MAG: TolC family protein [Bacteroidia bacterium]|nr:TolC family protein [Bacteroidia bacterium]
MNDLMLQSAQKSVAAAKGNMYPNISAFGGLSTNYVDIKVPQFQGGPKTPTGATVNVSGTDYDVVAPSFIIVGEKVIPLGKQFRNNFGQNIGIGLNVPIFNGRVARTNWERSKLNVRLYELQKEQGEQQLKQDIYTAYTNAVAALQKFNADKKTVETTTKVYEFAQKRYDVNLLSTYDLITSQNNMQSAKYQALYSTI